MAIVIVKKINALTANLIVPKQKVEQKDIVKGWVKELFEKKHNEEKVAREFWGLK